MLLFGIEIDEGLISSDHWQMCKQNFAIRTSAAQCVIVQRTQALEPPQAGGKSILYLPPCSFTALAHILRVRYP